MWKSVSVLALCLGLAGVASAQEDGLTAKELSKLDDAKGAAASDATSAAAVETSATAVDTPVAAPLVVPTAETEPITPPPPAAVAALVKPTLDMPESAETADATEAAVTPRPMPLPLVITETILEVCLPTLRGERSLFDGLPASATEGADETVLERFIARPQSGDLWTLSTLEGPMLLGNLHDREGACQVMGATPLGNVVMEKVSETLAGLESPFTVSDETGTDFGTPIHWRRFVSAERDFIDVLHYKGVPGGRVSTIHVIVG